MRVLEEVLDLDELDRLYAEAMKVPEGWSADAKNERARRLRTFGLAMRNRYPTLRARLRELEADGADWQRSFDLYFRATRKLHDLFPHPDPLTTRDTGQVCAMAAEEITALRAELEAVKRERDELRAKRDGVVRRCREEVELFKSREEYGDNDETDSVAASISRTILEELT